jgi:DNA modification methylase
MLSFAGDPVTDDRFGETATSALAALETPRNNVGAEIRPWYGTIMANRFQSERIARIVEVVSQVPLPVQDAGAA